MKFKINENNFDRVVRFLLSGVAFYYAIFSTNFLIQILLIFTAIGLFFNAASGFCGIYHFFGISTCPVTPKSKNKRSK